MVEAGVAVARPVGVESKKKQKGKVAFVFPGSGVNFAGMGRELSAAFPQVLARQDAENERLGSQFGGVWEKADREERLSIRGWDFFAGVVGDFYFGCFAGVWGEAGGGDWV